MAWVYVKYANEPAYFATEKIAKAAQVGLWSQPNPIAPWDFRHGGQTASSTGQQAIKIASCGTKLYCKDMADCEEAKFYLTQCGLTRLDRDGDGVPCESLCK